MAWPCYRLLDEGKATLTELHQTLSIDDVAETNDVLDAIALARVQNAS